jgi:hypothetical protein
MVQLQQQWLVQLERTGCSDLSFQVFSSNEQSKATTVNK